MLPEGVPLLLQYFFYNSRCTAGTSTKNNSITALQLPSSSMLPIFPSIHTVGNNIQMTQSSREDKTTWLFSSHQYYLYWSRGVIVVDGWLNVTHKSANAVEKN